MTSNTLPRLRHAAELSARVGISRKRLYELAAAGEIPHVRLGRAVLFNDEAVRAWIEAGCPNRETWEKAKGSND